jgi:FAD/FMN-containing dehydrogenase
MQEKECTCRQLPADHLERVEAWGMSLSTLSYVWRPSTAGAIAPVFEAARANSRTVALRGAGLSYGDASLGNEQVVLDLTRMNRILDWNPETGRITVEPGVTIRQLWQYCLEDGWWPPVVSGTMQVSLGGAAGMNIHGKNNFKAGPIGEHILEIDLMLASGERLTCSHEKNADVFHAAISGFGMLGVITRLTLQMKRVYSGYLNVLAFSTQSFGEIIAEFEERKAGADYLVGWIDCFATGAKLGRGLVHQANYLQPGEDPAPAQSLRVINQELPDTLMGVFPKSLMGKMLQPFTNNLGMRLINTAKFLQGDTIGNNESTQQPHAQFAFLLDYVPNWKHAYKPGALIQFQSFVPAEHAERVFSEEVRISQKLGIVPFLGVFKRHRPDAFLMTHAVDGFSLALDYPYTAHNKDRMAVLAEQMARMVVEAGGRFYYAKDSLLPPQLARQAMGADRIERFCALKSRLDPENILQTDLSRRLYGGFAQ